jgi:hypothetical protein
MFKFTYDTSLWPRMAKQEKQRLVYTIDYLEHGEKQKAAQVSGLTSRNAFTRIIGHLKKYGRFGEAVHERERLKFTDAAMQAAVDTLTDISSGYMNTQQLLQELQTQGILPAQTNATHFREALQQYLQERDMFLAVGKTTIFRITDKNAKERVAFVRQYIPLLEKWGLENVVIVDETTIEESPHPKGKHAQ